MKLLHSMVQPPLRGLSAFSDRSVSEVPGYDPVLCAGDSDARLPEARWVAPLSGSLLINSPEGLACSLAPGTTALAAAGCIVRSDDEVLTVRLPDYRGGTLVASRLPNGPVDATNAAAYRPIIGDDAFGHSVSRLLLRNDIPFHVPTESAVTLMLMVSGAAMAFSCKPGEDELIPDFTRFLIDQRMDPEDIARSALADFEGQMQEALDARLARSYGSALNPRPSIGDPDSGLNYAQPIIPGSLLILYPGDLIYLSSVAVWGQAEFLTLRARLLL